MKKNAESFTIRKSLLGATILVEDFEKRKPTDIYEMALAYEAEERILLQLELAHSEKYPEVFSAQQIASIKEEIQRLTRRIHAWQNRQFPSQYRD